MGILQNYEPKNVFKFFEKICTIPRGSGNTDAIAEYLVNFAKERGLYNYRDEANNVILRKPATPGYEDADTIILQGHHDMVCEKVADLDFDFTKDAIVPVVDGDYIKTNGTTLGADNGIAVAMMLAILDDDTIEHPEIECLITADEEIGLIGAFALDCSQLKGHKLINLDSEDEGILMCSCAGGVNVRSIVPVERTTLKGLQLSFEINGLKSGHSGVEIDKGRANSNVLVGRILYALNEEFGLNIVSIEGGSRETAIANAAKVSVLVNPDYANAAYEKVVEIGSIFKKEYTTAEPDIDVIVTMGDILETEAVTKESSEKITYVINALPDAVQAMSIDFPGLVQTSLNFGVLKLEDKQLTLCNTVRSSMTSQKNWISTKVSSIVKLAGGKTVLQGNYPGWAFNPKSEVSDIILKAYKKLFNKEAKVDAVHAGIECGLFADAIENLDAVSIGPTMGDVHTPNEHLSISSTERTYKLIVEVLKCAK